MPCFEFNQCSSCLSCGFESKWAVMERQPLGQLQAVNLFQTEEVQGLKKMQKKRINNGQYLLWVGRWLAPQHHPSQLHPRQTCTGLSERSPAPDDVMGTSTGSLWAGRGSCGAPQPQSPGCAAQPGGAVAARALGPFPQGTVRIPLSGSCPAQAHGDTRGQHEEGPAPRALGWLRWRT